MSGKVPAVRHLAYFDTLAEMEESDASWRAVSAGLVVLRLLDAWLEEGPQTVAPGSWSVQAVREAVQAIDAGDPSRAILAGIVDAMEGAQAVALAPLAPRLMAYGRALDYVGRFRLAGDVYRTVLAHVHPGDDADVAADAQIQYGYCMRMVGEWDEAAGAYAAAGRIADAAGDPVRALRARMAEARLALTRGNLPEADRILDAAIDEATTRQLTEVRALALHTSATVAHARGDFERAIRLAYEALEGLSNPMSRDRALADIAAAFAELGVRSVAREAQLVLAATAQEQYSRWQASINLLEIAALDRFEPVFEQYRRELAEADLPPFLAAMYHLYVGEGLRLFGRMEAARVALERALALATQNRFNQLLFRAEEALRRTPLPPKVSVPAPESVRHVAVAIGRLNKAVAAR